MNRVGVREGGIRNLGQIGKRGFYKIGCLLNDGVLSGRKRKNPFDHKIRVGGSAVDDGIRGQYLYLIGRGGTKPEPVEHRYNRCVRSGIRINMLYKSSRRVGCLSVAKVPGVLKRGVFTCGTDLKYGSVGRDAHRRS